MEITVLIITNILAPIITGFASWLMAKKKYYSEVDSTVIANMKESLEFYKQLSDDNRERLKEVLDKNDQLEKEISELKSQMLKLAMNICMDLTCKNRVLETKQ
jgi:hypothetical protein